VVGSSARCSSSVALSVGSTGDYMIGGSVSGAAAPGIEALLHGHLLVYLAIRRRSD
jgi:hypothetical protein